ncbi:MAG: hypothetical protein WAM04_02340 [Candidatus Sulfotelmatobacter sp.]
MIHFFAVGQMYQPPTPPSCSECATKSQAPGSGAPAQSSRMWRSSTGKMRIDTPSASIISSPADQKTILLDHLKKVAMVIPMPPTPGAAPSGSTKMPDAAAPAPPMQIQDLGKSLIEGHEVEGKRYVLPAAQKPPAPPMPKMPPLPQMPKAPQMSQPPQSQPPQSQPPQLPKAPPLPKPPQPTVAEVWTSVKLKTPVLTKVTSALGSQTTYCKPTSTDEPHPSLFEIPPGYKLKSS